MTTTSDRTGLAFLCLFAFVTLAACGTKDQPQPVGLVPDASAAVVVEAGPVDITKCAGCALAPQTAWTFEGIYRDPTCTDPVAQLLAPACAVVPAVKESCGAINPCCNGIACCCVISAPLV